MAASTQAAPVSINNALPGWGVTQERVDEAVERIARACNPLRVVAFGSWARGEAGPDSDLDLAVFLDGKSDQDANRLAYHVVSGLPMKIDLLSFDTQRHERLKISRNSVHWFIAHEGRVLYQRKELDPMTEELLKASEDDLAVLPLAVPDRIFGFHAQQGVEKLLKVLIAARGVTFERTHDLMSLREHLHTMGEEVPLRNELAATLQPYSVLFRYDGAPALKETRQAILEQLGTLRSFVLKRLAELTPAA